MDIMNVSDGYSKTSNTKKYREKLSAQQISGFCGPASLEIVFNYYGVSVSQDEIAKIAGTSEKRGTSIEGLIKAAKHFGFFVFFKEKSSLNDLRYFIRRKIPVIVAWFLNDDGHYSVVVDINRKTIVLMDPLLSYVKRRRMSLEKFLRVWFDFPEDYIRSPEDLLLRTMLVVTPFKIEMK